MHKKSSSNIKTKIYSFIILSIFAVILNAQNSVTISDEFDQRSVNSFLEILEDTSGSLSIEDVISPEYSKQFQTNYQTIPSFGFTNSVYWVRFKINSINLKTFTPWVLELVYPIVHYVDLYHLDKQNKILDITKTGTMREIKTRDYICHHLVFLISLNNLLV